ncbi:Sec-independent protein translocase subunit TatA [Gulosibacter molinativorax]|uniref:Sec-independent protein translocase protein TatA n=1 Tax=Gulosibacter molinativorax TaxID=256821 RepID=A0ABT7C5U7_9MICO|nr:Sec-independent protein translocase subunit TatA [Gulosibacter molinativorax]MDJ1370139.1 twin-arginine translocase TatA/TatE family subunit [Gulosibacter molinativorax]QUY61550.1 Sec-independent protein translocase protein TatA [Gulosibacter molinativorax]
MIGNMGGWTFVIILVIILLLFGAPKLPQLAKSLGESMRIFKGEMKTMKKESSTDDAGTAKSAGTAAGPAPTQSSGDATPNPNEPRASDTPSDSNDTTNR